MKKLLFSALILLSIVSATAQIQIPQIEVTGSAEAEVKPDIIYFSITLQEYKEGGTRVNINKLENQLVKALTDAGIPKEDLAINDVSGDMGYEHKKAAGFLASKEYRIKFHDLDKINQILSHIDEKGIEATNIDSYEYSKIIELKKELKLKALIAAKEKAAYLLNGIGEKLGGAINITEIDDNSNRNYSSKSYGYEANTVMNPEQYSSLAQNIDFKKIKYNFQIRAVFEIVK